MGNAFYSEKLKKPNFLWRIVPYGFVKKYLMKHRNDEKEIIVQSRFFGRNESGIDGDNCRLFNYINLGKGLYYIVSSNGVIEAEISRLEDEIERLKGTIELQDAFVFDEDEELRDK